MGVPILFRCAKDKNSLFLCYAPVKKVRNVIFPRIDNAFKILYNNYAWLKIFFGLVEYAISRNFYRQYGIASGKARHRYCHAGKRRQ